MPATATPPRPRLSSPAAVLLEAAAEAGCSDLAACRDALAEAREQRRPLVSALLDLALFSESGFLECLAAKVGMPWFGDQIQPLPAPLRERFPVRIALRHHLLPQPNRTPTTSGSPISPPPTAPTASSPPARTRRRRASKC